MPPKASDSTCTALSDSPGPSEKMASYKTARVIRLIAVAMPMARMTATHSRRSRLLLLVTSFGSSLHAGEPFTERAERQGEVDDAGQLDGVERDERGLGAPRQRHSSRRPRA